MNNPINIHPKIRQSIAVLIFLFMLPQISQANFLNFDPPIATCQDLTINLDVAGMALITPGMVDNGSFDNSTPVTLALDISDFSCDNLGFNEVTLTVTDQNDDFSTCTSNVAVIASDFCPTPLIANSGGNSVPEACTCRGNFEFDEEIVVNSLLPNQVWTVTATTLLENGTGQAFAPGTVLTENNGHYSLAGYHIDGQGYSISIESFFYPNLILNLSNTCFYPKPVFENLNDFYCLSSSDILLEVSGLAGIEGSGNFTIDDSNATFFSPSSLGIGTYLIEYSFDAENPAGASEPADVGCETTISKTVEVVQTPAPVCQNDAMVTADFNCSKKVLPEEVLIGNYDCFDDYSVLIFDASQNFGNFIPANQLDTQLEFSVTNTISGEECTGFVTLKDLTPPIINCQNQNVNCFAMFTPTVFDNCDQMVTAILINETILDTGICDNDTLVVERIWEATDASGNISSQCADTTQFIRVAPENIIFPNNVQFSCTKLMNNPNLTDPEFSGTPSPVGGFCEYEANFSDVMLASNCDDLIIERTWAVTDWCTGMVYTTNASGQSNVQTIMVSDETPPEIQTDPVVLEINTPAEGMQNCTVLGVVPPPTMVTDNCHDWTISIFVNNTELNYNNGVDGADGGSLLSPGLEVGEHILIYEATDDCGNVGQFETTITVEDNTPPQPVCPLNLLIELDESGEVIIPASDFDGGSTDNCCIENFEAQRLPNNQSLFNCLPLMPNNFESETLFCCEDIKFGPVDLILRVFDCYGNSADCNLTVTVADVHPTEIITCPANQVIDCEFYQSNLQTLLEANDYSVLDIYGEAVFSDNCQFSVSSQVSVNIDNCFSGTLIRTWIADDTENPPTNCTQTISVVHVSDWVVEFPEDKMIVCSQNSPDFGTPEIFFNNCEIITISHEDETIIGQNNICYQIERTWAVVNWCVVGSVDNQEVTEVPESQLSAPFNDLNGDGQSNDRTFRDSWNGSSFPDFQQAGMNGAPDTDPDLDPWDGYIEYTQMLEIQDNVVPSFPIGCEAPEVCVGSGNCKTTVTIPIIPIEDCTGVFAVTVTSDLGLGLGAFYDVSLGDYAVAYEAVDFCGNVSVCQTTLKVKDCTAPVIDCVADFSVDFADGNGTTISVDVNNLIGQSTDNCTENLIHSFLQNELVSTLTYNCDAAGTSTSVEIWVSDNAGNQDNCQVNLTITDNLGLCMPMEEIDLSGNIQTEEGVGIAQVEVSLNSSNNNNVFVTDASGDYEFTNINSGDDITIVPFKNINPENGLTTFDLVLITKHILNQEMLDSPYKIIAADANASNSVSTFDLVIFRKVILFIDPDFGAVPAWRFIDADYEFDDPTNPFSSPFPEIVNINDVSQTMTNLDFIGVKLGDVNNSADPLNLIAADDRNFENNLKIKTQNQFFEKGKTYQIPFYLTDFQHIGFQFTLEFENEFLDFEKFESNYLKEENIGLNFLSEGIITTSWFDLSHPEISENEPIFTLHFQSKSEANLEDLISINSKFTKAEAYNFEEQTEGIELEFLNNSSNQLSEITVFPNPFEAQTQIQFFNPIEGNVDLIISDISGKMIFTMSQFFSEGRQNISISKNDLNEKGIYFYQLKIGKEILKGKMILN